MNTVVKVKSYQEDPKIQAVIQTLAEIGNQMSGSSQLIVGYYYRESDYPLPGFSYYYLAEMAKTKVLGFIPWTKRRVLVSMNDPNRNYGGEVGCTILNAQLRKIAAREVRKHAKLVGAKKVTILEDLDPLYL